MRSTWVPVPLIPVPAADMAQWVIEQSVGLPVQLTVIDHPVMPRKRRLTKEQPFKVMVGSHMSTWLSVTAALDNAWLRKVTWFTALVPGMALMVQFPV